MPTSLDIDDVRAALEAHDSCEFLERGRNLVQSLPNPDRAQLKRLLGWLPDAPGPDLTDFPELGAKERMLMFLHMAENMPDDVEREGRKLVVADMNTLSPVSLPYSYVRTLSLQEKGWPLDAKLIHLDGLLEPENPDRSMVYFVHRGAVHLMLDGEKQSLLQGAQAALAAKTKHSLYGKATLYAFECQPHIGGSTVIEHFDDEKKKNKCPCGWSYRIPLTEKGEWGFSTHRTKMKGLHDATHDGFAGHQHKKTHEIYFTDELNGVASITVDGVEMPLSVGTLVAIPNGTMHTVDSDEEITQHIFVGKGHKNDDFWTASWRPLTYSVNSLTKRTRFCGRLGKA